MSKKRAAGQRGPAAVAQARALTGAAEAAIGELERRRPENFGSLERAAAARIWAAAERLLECASELAEDRLVVPGSTGQRRPHPLLRLEQELRKEIVDALHSSYGVRRVKRAGVISPRCLRGAGSAGGAHRLSSTSVSRLICAGWCRMTGYAK